LFFFAALHWSHSVVEALVNFEIFFPQTHFLSEDAIASPGIAAEICGTQKRVSDAG
jgi:hypothetical protein